MASMSTNRSIVVPGWSDGRSASVVTRVASSRGRIDERVYLVEARRTNVGARCPRKRLCLVSGHAERGAGAPVHAPVCDEGGASVRGDRVNRRAVTTIAVLSALVGSVFVISPASAAVKSQVRGFDGTTIKVASLGFAAQVGTSQIGAK